MKFVTHEEVDQKHNIQTSQAFKHGEEHLPDLDRTPTRLQNIDRNFR